MIVLFCELKKSCKTRAKALPSGSLFVWYKVSTEALGSLSRNGRMFAQVLKSVFFNEKFALR
ncbi:hypothetical protein MFLAVUS_006853 [Mucor flavus]|uniref:Ribosomal protein L32 n=1 Tax=Mucor flavus TaxID=439312 RepID=A0ABP9Z2P2_9FUNG